MTTTHLRLDPLDVLFFRDGRPFEAATRAAGGLPLPQTFAGAMRTALLSEAGFDFKAFSVKSSRNPLELMPDDVRRLRFRGPWLARHLANQVVEPLLPVPVNLIRGEGEQGRWFRADPRPTRLPGWKDDLLPLWHEGGPKAKRPEGYLTPAGINAYLNDEAIPDNAFVNADDLYGFDHRTGIEIDPVSLTARDGQLYGIRFLALKKGVCLYAQIVDPAGDAPTKLPEVIPFGGEGKCVAVSKEMNMTAPWTQANAAKRALWLLAAPAIFQPGKNAWKPGMLDLRAAAVGTPLAVSGWDLARGGPKPTRFAVPAGSVYFTEHSPSETPDSLCSDLEDIAQGWGYALRGIWK